nr:stage II sporulation protein D [uncultured Solibaculum sp.]
MKKYVGAAVLLFFFLLFAPILACLGEGFTPKSSGSDSSGSQNINTNDTFALFDESTGEVITLSARDYLLGAVASEMPPSFHSEALKAQAAASYTYAYRRRAQQEATPDETLKGADFSVDTSQKEGYLSKEQAKEQWGNQFDASWSRIEGAVDEVLGKLIVYQGEPVLAVYHAMSGGTTETAQVYWGNDVPYLQSTDSPGDPLAPQYETASTFTTDEMKQKLTAPFSNVALGEDPSTWFGQPQLSAAGTVVSIPVGDQTVSGRDLRTALGLRSANFSLSFADNVFTITVHGYGHGVGLSQYGADYMARQGAKWQDIIRHYYQNVEITTAPGYSDTL